MKKKFVARPKLVTVDHSTHLTSRYVVNEHSYFFNMLPGDEFWFHQGDEPKTFISHSYVRGCGDKWDFPGCMSGERPRSRVRYSVNGEERELFRLEPHCIIRVAATHIVKIYGDDRLRPAYDYMRNIVTPADALMIVGGDRDECYTMHLNSENLTVISGEVK